MKKLLILCSASLLVGCSEGPKSEYDVFNLAQTVLPDCELRTMPESMGCYTFWARDTDGCVFQVVYQGDGKFAKNLMFKGSTCPLTNHVYSVRAPKPACAIVSTSTNHVQLEDYEN